MPRGTTDYAAIHAIGRYGRFAVLVHAVGVVLCLVACAGQTRGDRPQRLEPLPPGGEPNDALLSVGQPVDTNANGCVDTFQVVLYLFEPNESVLSMWSEGRLSLRLIGSASEELARWEFNEDALRAARQKLPPGPGYILTVSMLSLKTGDVFASQQADVYAEFTTPKGATVRRSVGGIRVGGRNPGG